GFPLPPTFLLPSRAFGGVFGLDADLVQAVPDRVRGGVIAARPRRVPLLQGQLHQRAEHVAQPFTGARGAGRHIAPRRRAPPPAPPARGGASGSRPSTSSMVRAWARLVRTPALSEADSAWLPSLTLACTAASAAGTARASAAGERDD